jgi:hypothetical protein
MIGRPPLTPPMPVAPPGPPEASTAPLDGGGQLLAHDRRRTGHDAMPPRRRTSRAPAQRNLGSGRYEVVRRCSSQVTAAVQSRGCIQHAGGRQRARGIDARLGATPPSVHRCSIDLASPCGGRRSVHKPDLGPGRCDETDEVVLCGRLATHRTELLQLEWSGATVARWVVNSWIGSTSASRR